MLLQMTWVASEAEVAAWALALAPAMMRRVGAVEEAEREGGAEQHLPLTPLPSKQTKQIRHHPPEVFLPLIAAAAVLTQTPIDDSFALEPPPLLGSCTFCEFDAMLATTSPETRFAQLVLTFLGGIVFSLVAVAIEEVVVAFVSVVILLVVNIAEQ
jgi:hypothetical protein